MTHSCPTRLSSDLRIKDAVVFGAPPPPIEGLSSTGGFEAFVQSRNGSDYRALEAATNKLVAAAAGRKELAGVLPALVHRCLSYGRSEEHTSELQSLMRISYAVFCLKKKTIN